MNARKNDGVTFKERGIYLKMKKGEVILEDTGHKIGKMRR